MRHETQSFSPVDADTVTYGVDQTTGLVSVTLVGHQVLTGHADGHYYKLSVACTAGRFAIAQRAERTQAWLLIGLYDDYEEATDHFHELIG
jgi:hypothetical protein